MTRFLDGEAKQHRQVRDRTRGELLFVEREKMTEVARRVHILQAKFGDGFRQGAREAGCLSDGGEIGQPLRGDGGVDNARGERFNAEAGDGCERETAHGLGGEVRGELRESERVNALAAGWKSAGGELVCGGSRRRDDEDFGVLGYFAARNAAARWSSAALERE